MRLPWPGFHLQQEALGHREHSLGTCGRGGGTCQWHRSLTRAENKPGLHNWWCGQPTSQEGQGQAGRALGLCADGNIPGSYSPFCKFRGLSLPNAWRRQSP